MRHQCAHSSVVDRGWPSAAGGSDTQGNALLPEDSVPTWEECRRPVEQRRDHHLQRAAKWIDRLRVALEAIGNDIAEAREFPNQPLGVDLLASTSYSFNSGQTTLSAILQQFDLARMEVQRYHSALADIVEVDRP